jgi:hypothetical protein
MLFQSRRFIEYFPAFALLFAAFAWTPVFQAFKTGQAENPIESHPHPGRRDRFWARAWLGSRFQKSIPGLALVLALVPGLWLTFNGARASLQNSKPYQTYAGASAWLAANSPAGARVFQTDWDDFPRLFYYNTHNTYLIGLDPTYMLLYDEDLYRLWVDVTRGDVEQPAAAIAQEFGARYVVTDLRHQDFLAQAAQDPGLEEVYRDEEAVVFQLANRELPE